MSATAMSASLVCTLRSSTQLGRMPGPQARSGRTADPRYAGAGKLTIPAAAGTSGR